MSELPSQPEKKHGTSGYSWKLCAGAAVAAVIAAVVSWGEVSPIITGLILLTAVGWGFTARDNLQENGGEPQ